MYIMPEQEQRILADIHDGVCGNHAGRQALVYKMMRQGYYWLTLRKDAITYAKVCHIC